ncbi:MAG: YunC family protein [Symbiobacteriia bacterium]
MVEMTPISIDGRIAVGITVDLPKTRLVAISTSNGYIMCGALDVNLLNTRLADREIVAGRALGVRTLDDLLTKPLESVTQAALRLGVREGMTGKDALSLMF